MKLEHKIPTFEIGKCKCLYEVRHPSISTAGLTCIYHKQRCFEFHTASYDGNDTALMQDQRTLK